MINQVLYITTVFTNASFFFLSELPLLIQLGDEIAGIGTMGTTATTLGPTAAQYDLISGSPPPASPPTTNSIPLIDTGAYNQYHAHDVTVLQVAQCNHRI